jgi:DNA-directed RNA polymerase subunit RPC12/RpoP
MALIKCAECGGEVSTEAIACPKCGAKPKRKSAVVKYGGGFIAAMFVLAVVATMMGGNSTKTREEPKAIPVDFDKPLETGPGTLACSAQAAFDAREGRGLKAAMKSRNSVFSRREEAEKAGCEEWREGLGIRLSAEDARQAKEWQTNVLCGMLSFGNNFVFSCDLKNAGATSQKR